MYSPVLKAGVDKDLCVGCGQCVQACPLGAIDLGEKARIDQSRCILCGNCLQVCPQGAIGWTYEGQVKRTKVDGERVQSLQSKVLSLSGDLKQVRKRIKKLKEG